MTKTAYYLTSEQANIVKDILRLIGRDDSLNSKFASALEMTDDEFNEETDAAFTALGNGRIVQE